MGDLFEERQDDMLQEKLRIAFLVNMPLCNIAGGAEQMLSEILGEIDLDKFDVTILLEQPQINQKYLSSFQNRVRIITIYNYWCGYYRNYSSNVSGSILRWKFFPPSGIVRKIVKFLLFKRKLSEIVYSNDIIIETETFYFLKHINQYKIKPIAKVIGWHHTDINEFVRFTNGLRKFETNPILLMDSVFFVNNSIKEQAKEYLKDIKPSLVDQVFYTPNGINPQKIKLLAERTENLNDYERKLLNSDYILMVARVAKSKGHSIAIQAFSKVLTKFPQLKLIFVGALAAEGNGELDVEIMALGLSERVIFLGAKHNPYVWMKNCKLALLCSSSEAFGLVVLEYMVFNRQIIVSDIPQLIDAFGDSVNYFLSQNPHNLAEKMLAVLGSDLHVDLAAKYKSLLDRYSITAATRYFETLLLHVANRQDAEMS